MRAAKFTPGSWLVVATSCGFQVSRVWTSGFYQVLRDSHRATKEEAEALLAKAQGGAA